MNRIGCNYWLTMYDSVSSPPDGTPTIGHTTFLTTIASIG